jgi:hypothetical protein
MIRVILLVHAAATIFMTGLIWFVQVVHYPLFAAVGRDHFPAYEGAHTQLVSLVVIPAMLTELLTAVLLVIAGGQSVRLGESLGGLVLLAVVWGSTFFLQVPRHTELAGGFDEAAHRALVTTNWVRTIGWSLRGLLSLLMIARVMK